MEEESRKPCEKELIIDEKQIGLPTVELHEMVVPVYPKLGLLIRHLDDELSSSGSSIRVDNLLKKANLKMRHAKVNYLQKVIMYSELRKIALSLMPHFDNRTSDSFQFPALKQLLTVTEVMAKLRCTSNGPDDANTLLEDKDFPSLKISYNELVNSQKILTQRLSNRRERLAQLCYSIKNNLNEEGKQDTFVQLLSLVDNMLERLKEIKDQSNNAVKVQRNLIENHRQLSSKDAKLLISIAQMILTYNLDEERFAYLTLKFKILMLKIRVFTLEIEAKTYSAKTMQAHQRISEHLRKATDDAETKRIVFRQQLTVYESTSSEFNVLLQSYSSILQETKECEWLLAKLPEHDAR